MKAITQQDPDDPGSLTLTDVPDPVPQAGEVLVKVRAAGVNRGDLLQARGRYPPPKGASAILGLECAGVIVDAGDTGRQVGEEVACLLTGGGYAELVAVPAGQLLPIPAGFTLTEAASVVEVACTVWANLGMDAGVRRGQRVLVHGGAGGIGTFAVQLLKALGAEVAVTAGSAEKLAVCQALGADVLVNYREQDFADVLAGRCDVILDIIGAKYLERNLRALADDGQLVIIGLQGGAKAELNLGVVLPRRLTIRGATLRARGLESKAAIVQDTIANVWPLIADGRIRTYTHAALPLADAAKAHALLDAGEVTGKLVLDV